MRVNQGDGHRNRGKPRRNAEPIRWLLCRKARHARGCQPSRRETRGGHRPPQPQRFILSGMWQRPFVLEHLAEIAASNRCVRFDDHCRQ